MSKGVIKVFNRECPYVQLPNAIFEDNRISFKAKGVLAYLISKPNGWMIQVEDLYNKSVEGYSSIRGAIDELLLTGYMEMRNDFDPERGVFTGRYYRISPEPFFTTGYRLEENKNKGYKLEERLLDELPTRKVFKIKYDNDKRK